MITYAFFKELVREIWKVKLERDCEFAPKKKVGPGEEVVGLMNPLMRRIYVLREKTIAQLRENEKSVEHGWKNIGSEVSWGLMQETMNREFLRARAAALDGILRATEESVIYQRKSNRLEYRREWTLVQVPANRAK